MSAPGWSLSARWILPQDRPALPDGVLRIQGERIVALEPRDQATGAVDLNLGQVAVLPGLVNAHVHLDLTGMRGLAPPRLPLPGWLRDVVTYRRQHAPEQIATDIRTGIMECLRTGTTLVGDISGDGTSWQLLADSPLRAVVFRELLGLTADRARVAFEQFRQWRSQLLPSETCRPGISPHAPYSVRHSLYETAAKQGLPLATHFAESPEELQLLASQTGPLRGMLEYLGVWDPAGLVSDLPALLDSLRSAPSILLAHGNYLPDEIELPHHATLVYCPRTHEAFGHSRYPLARYLAKGYRVGLGTDGLASNPDLDLFAEARRARALHPEVPAETVLRLATLAGAEALGMADVTGSLTPGKMADLIVVALPEGGFADPETALLSTPSTVLRAMIAGNWIRI